MLTAVQVEFVFAAHQRREDGIYGEFEEEHALSVFVEFKWQRSTGTIKNTQGTKPKATFHCFPPKSPKLFCAMERSFKYG